MTKEELLRFLEPFSDDIPLRVRFYHHDRGQVIESITRATYGFENDHDGVVYLELEAR